jgi:hypothetical protein
MRDAGVLSGEAKSSFSSRGNGMPSKVPQNISQCSLIENRQTLPFLVVFHITSVKLTPNRNGASNLVKKGTLKNVIINIRLASSEGKTVFRNCFGAN